MRWKTAGAAAVAVALLIAPLTAMSAAADEIPAEEPVVVEEVAAPAEAPIVETPAEEAPAAPEEVTPEPVVEAPVDVAPTLLEAAKAKPVVPVFVEWVVPVGVEPAPLDKVQVPEGARVDSDGFPQWALGNENAPTCDAWVQGDWYPSQEIADRFLADGKLTNGEDHGFSSGWVFRYLGDCEPPVEPIACVAGESYTEGDDVAPRHEPEGYVFESAGDGKAVGLRWATTGNLAGFAPISFTATDADLSQFFFRATIDTSAYPGGKGYQSLSAPGATTIDASTVIYQNVVGAGNTLGDIAAAYPNALLTSVGFQTNSAAAAGTYATLTGMTGGCGSFDFTYTPEPEVVVPNPQAEIVSTCGAATVTLSNPGSEGVVTQTASFVVEIDGEFFGAYSVEEGKTWTIDAVFPEDSGDHIIQVFQAGISEWAKIAEAQVESDCVTPEPTPTPEEPTETPVPVVPASTASGTLAQTGSELPAWGFATAAALIMAMGAALTVIARRNRGAGVLRSENAESE